jgi:hypothetical protein
MKITKPILIHFARLTDTAQYNEENKEKYRKLGKKILQELANQIGLAKGQYDIHWNPGGIACSGDHTLHGEKFYVALHDNTNSGWFYYRTCNGRQDCTGGRNIIVYWDQLINCGIEGLANAIKRECFKLPRGPYAAK